MNKAFEDHTQFDTRTKEGLYFVRLLKNNCLFAWEDEEKFGTYQSKALRVKLTDVEIDTLKELKVWQELSIEKQTELEQYAEDETKGLHTHMHEMRKKRRSKYEGVPREVVCSNCGKKQKMAPSVIVKKAEKEVRSIENWIKDYQCQKCCPSKGRKADPKYAGLPSEFVCKCGNTAKTSPYVIVKKAEQLGVTPQQVIDDYQCQSCNPTKRGRRKKTKKGKK